MRTALLVLVLALSSTLPAQTPAPSNAAILAKIAALEQEIAALKAQLAPEAAPAIARPPTLAEAAAEAATVKHEWPRSTTYTNTDLVDGPKVAAPPVSATPAPDQEQLRQGDYNRAALRDELYWKTRMQDVHAKLDADRTFLADAIARARALELRLQSISNRILRATVETDWNAAVAEVGRLNAQVTNDARAITTAEEEARRANVPPGWLRP